MNVILPLFQAGVDFDSLHSKTLTLYRMVIMLSRFQKGIPHTAKRCMLIPPSKNLGDPRISCDSHRTNVRPWLASKVCRVGDVIDQAVRNIITLQDFPLHGMHKRTRQMSSGGIRESHSMDRLPSSKKVYCRRSCRPCIHYSATSPCCRIEPQ